MIANDEQLKVVRGQTTRLEEGLQSLARTVRPKSENQFKVMAEGYVDQLETLRREIDVYLGVDTVRQPEPDIEISIEGTNIALGETRVSAVTRPVDRFRRALRTTVDAVRDSMSPADRENITEDFVDRLCDPPLQGIAPGSVRVQLASPHFEVGNDLYGEGLKLLSLAIRAVDGEQEANAQFGELPVDRRQAALTAAKILTPEKEDLVEQVGLGGRFIGKVKYVYFNYETRRTISKQLSHIQRESLTVTVRGVIREVDLDRRLFSLREMDTGVPLERCKYARTHDALIRGLLDRQVEVRGARRSKGSRSTRLRVDQITEIGK